ITLSLMLHELATNAAKYGALSKPEGRLAIHWTAAEGTSATTVDLTWEEKDGPAVAPPVRKGFGSRLLAASALQLGAQFDLDYDRDGVRCRLRFAVAQTVV